MDPSDTHGHRRRGRRTKRPKKKLIFEKNDALMLLMGRGKRQTIKALEGQDTPDSTSQKERTGATQARLSGTIWDRKGELFRLSGNLRFCAGAPVVRPAGRPAVGDDDQVSRPANLSKIRGGGLVKQGFDTRPKNSGDPPPPVGAGCEGSVRAENTNNVCLLFSYGFPSPISLNPPIL